MYDNLDHNEELVTKLDAILKHTIKDDWIGHPMKEKRVRNAVKEVLGDDNEALLDSTMEIIKKQNEYK